MTTPPENGTEQAPIYAGLVEEHGDVMAETRQALEQVQRQARQDLDWSDLLPAREEPADTPQPDRSTERHEGTTA